MNLGRPGAADVADGFALRRRHAGLGHAAPPAHTWPEGCGHGRTDRPLAPGRTGDPGPRGPGSPWCGGRRPNCLARADGAGGRCQRTRARLHSPGDLPTSRLNARANAASDSYLDVLRDRRDLRPASRAASRHRAGCASSAR
ncbi:MAG: hypothetical protein MZW92_80890 [Comamonadaceae bacterium]|nr:hypothetical protein [Comamonadaceae bacterium]